MTKPMTPKQIAEATDKRIEQIYYRRCDRVQISIMDIPKVFATGRAAILAEPGISDEALGDRIAAFVETIRHS
jgi:hypothetical protein